MAPLLDPFKYLVGKYNHNDSNLFNLPSFNNLDKINPKISDYNNSSYIDGFFSFLTSQVLHEHRFIHGLDYYGSFLAIKNNYKINIIDDLDYLVQSDFFNKQNGLLFNVDDYSHLVPLNEIKSLKPIKILDSIKSNFSVKSFDNNVFENIFDDRHQIMSLEDIKQNNIELIDITTDFCDTSKLHESDTLKSTSTCSSRTSYTNENSFSEESIESIECVNNENENKNNENENENNENENNDNISKEYNNSDVSSIEEELITLTFPKFPVQVICMEKCENTFDNLIMNGNLSEEEWFSALMQIIMTLITYQKIFSFTHNDLHTNNIMYIPTNKKHIYYTYKNKTYKVPTFGKIYKLIDFGRAIYKFNGKLFCSDSFQNGGDAATQYNTEPYFNNKKPRLEPNFSFDLCRLACSIFDYVVDDFDTIKNLDKCSSLVRLIVEWCIDDNGINVLYKNNRVERYPDFKLYKMISRCVHKHTPQAQLEREQFNKYLISNKNIPKNEFIIKIDELPLYF